jgi:pyruvate/2-oxoglutarate dehydrogenase complex dihydrolipoamide dehydrogenase (E3) component
MMRTIRRPAYAVNLLIAASGRRLPPTAKSSAASVSSNRPPKALTLYGTTGTIVGAQILVAEAGEMITEQMLAIKFAAQAFDKDVGKLSCCAA